MVDEVGADYGIIESKTQFIDLKNRSD